MSDDVEDPRGDLRWGSIPGLVADAAARFGDAEAVVDGEVRLSFAQLERDALAVTGAAIATGVHPGDRVAIWAPNMAESIVAALGLVGTGAALVPLNTRFKGPEAAYVLTRFAPVRCSPCAASSASTTPPCSRTRTFPIWSASSCSVTTRAPRAR